MCWHLFGGKTKPYLLGVVFAHARRVSIVSVVGVDSTLQEVSFMSPNLSVCSNHEESTMRIGLGIQLCAVQVPSPLSLVAL